MDTNTNSPLTLASLNSDKQNEIINFYANLQKIIEFSNKANRNLFVYLYGEPIGEYLWYKFREVNNLFNFLLYLDVKNREILLVNIFGPELSSYSGGNPLYANC